MTRSEIFRQNRDTAAALLKQSIAEAISAMKAFSEAVDAIPSPQWNTITAPPATPERN